MRKAPIPREQARDAVIEAARKVAAAHPKNFKFDWHYAQVLTDRISGLRKALQDLDGIIGASHRGVEGDKDDD